MENVGLLLYILQFKVLLHVDIVLYYPIIGL